VAGERTEEQVVAANVDTIFLVSGLDREFNLRRIERYLTLAWGSGATPVVILNKSDISPDLESRVAEVQAVAVGVSIHPLSAALGLGLEQLAPYFAPGRTVALLGSSGVGKSTLINRLLGEDLLPVQSVRESDDRGRHTTSRRELVLLPSGALIIDTPGLREVQLWSDEEGVGGAFGDIEDLARGCRFRDCTHTHEAGCAVKEASTSGTLLPARLKSYRKLQRELRHLAFRQSFRRMQEEKAKWKRTSKWIKEREKTRG
jgi:ribosome biogenesis GTPase